MVCGNGPIFATNMSFAQSYYLICVLQNSQRIYATRALKRRIVVAARGRHNGPGTMASAQLLTPK